MSEQTPEASNGMSDGQEPSMEDILASIRKIIADDDVGAAELASAQADTPGFGDVSEAEETLELDVVAESESANLDIPDMMAPVQDSPESGSDIELLLSDEGKPELLPEDNAEVLDLDIVLDERVDDSALEAQQPEAAAQDDEFEDVLSLLEDDMADITAQDAPVTPDIAAPTSEDNDLSLMLDDMLVDDAEDIAAQDTDAEDMDAEDMVIDPAMELLEIDEAEDEITTSGDADIDLVKSLMADLTEEPLHEEPIDDDMDASGLEIPDINPDIDTGPSDVMDEILSMTLDDEMQLQQAAELADAAITPDITQVALAQETSLLDIAAEARADAETMSPSMKKAGLGAAALGAAALMGGAAGRKDVSEEPLQVSADDVETDDVDSVLDKLDALIDEADSAEDIQTLDPDPIDEETPEMPRAATKDTIIDAVTETATADAFSSLNKVVEEKATVAERGDRIGDLVMEALRPMLKDWLDANLKGIVERAVTKEVKRISSGK